MKKQRPVNLDLTTIHFPVTAIVSILHRISGVILFLLIPLLLWFLTYSLSSQDDFNAIAAVFSHFAVRLVVWLLLAALIFHVVAGVRHLLMDANIGETLEGGRIGAWLVFVIAIIVVALLGLALLFGIHLI